jgi:hypothetical protein
MLLNMPEPDFRPAGAQHFNDASNVALKPADNGLR